MKKGFTLIELLGVIIILALIMIITFPSIINFIKKGNDSIDEAELKLIYNAADMYIRDNQSKFPKEDKKYYCIDIGSLSDDMLSSDLSIKYKNKAVQVIYDSKFNYELVDEDNCIKPICSVDLNDTVGVPYNFSTGVQKGNALICKVNKEKEYKFYVLSIEGNNFNLILDKNICNDGSFATDTNLCTVAWNASNNIANGPVTAFEYLNQATQDWSNIKYKYPKYTDKNNFYQNYSITGHARLATFDEMSDAGCSAGASCPAWAYSFLQPYGQNPNTVANLKGYWIMDAYSKTYPYYLYYSKELARSYAANNSARYGIRPVITVSKNEINSETNKTYMVDLSGTNYFKSSEYINKIKSISFVKYINTENSIKEFDLTDTTRNSAGSVTAWIDSNYNLFIGSNSEIYSKNMQAAFDGMSNVETVDLQNLNTSENTTLYHTFANMTNLKEIKNLNKMSTENVTTMYFMFYRDSSLQKLDLRNFNTSKVTNMSYMFDGTGLTTLDLSNFDTSKVTNMSYMFSNVSGITTLDLGSFDTSKVTNMAFMFYYSPKLKNIKLGNKFITGEVTSMNHMFARTVVEELDLSAFDTSKVTDMNSMFANTSVLKTLKLNKAVFTPTDATSMFLNTYNGINIIVKDKTAQSFIVDRLGEAGKTGTVTITG